VSAVPAPAANVTPTHVVFGRGGIRGIAMVGAAIGLQRAGYRIERASGVSVGGIVAALLASGYTPDELRQVVWGLDYAGMRDRHGRAVRLPGIGVLWSLLTRLGCYDGDALEHALRDLLARKGVRTFADLRAETVGAEGRYRLQVLCSDITRGRLVTLPDDAARYGVDPDRLEVAHALRISASLPFFFTPVRFGSCHGGSLLVDGGLVAGIPSQLFHAARRRPAVTGPVSLLRAAYYTALRANQACQDPARAAATIDIDCGRVGAIDFRISDPGKQALLDAGLAAVARFVRQTRTSSVDPALARVWSANQLSIAGG
jgi:NTE family protein